MPRVYTKRKVQDQSSIAAEASEACDGLVARTEHSDSFELRLLRDLVTEYRGKIVSLKAKLREERLRASSAEASIAS